MKRENNNYGKLIIKNNIVEKVVEAREFKSKNQPIVCNSGIFCASGESLLKLIPRIKNSNKKKRVLLN